VISNNLFLLKLKHPETDRARVESMERAVGSATKLTRQLLAFSRRQALVPEYVRLQERLPSFRDLLEPVLGRQIELVVMTAQDTPPILVDPAEFELALINLAVNARDAMPGGGHFRIAARNAAADELPPQLGCEVTRLDRAAAAEEWLSRQARLPDVLLSDVVMPGEIDGLALAQRARVRFPGLRIILITGYAEQMEAISRQGFEVLPKPCSAEMLAAAIAGQDGQRAS